MIVCELTLLFQVSIPVCDGRTQLFTLGHMKLHLQDLASPVALCKEKARLMDYEALVNTLSLLFAQIIRDPSCLIASNVY
jgi:hypothetical protein